MATHEKLDTCLVPSVLGKSIVTKQLTIESIKNSMIYVSMFFSVKYILGKKNHYFLVAKFFGVEKSFLKKNMVFF